VRADDDEGVKWPDAEETANKIFHPVLSWAQDLQTNMAGAKMPSDGRLCGPRASGEDPVSQAKLSAGMPPERDFIPQGAKLKPNLGK
jgi:hypothetical protein